MREIFVSILFLLPLTCGTLNISAQTDFTGRVYRNPNIMEKTLKEATKDLDSKMGEARKQAIGEAEKKKGRKLTTEELAEIDKKVEEAKTMANAMKKGMKVGIAVEFKSDKDLVMKTDMKIDDEALKAAGVSWVKRKAIKAALAIAPSSEKDTYVVKGNLIIVGTGKDMDTLYIVNNGQQLQGNFDKDTKFTLNRVTTSDATAKKK